MLEEAAPLRREGRDVEAVERGVPGFRAPAEPDGRLDRSLLPEGRGGARARATTALDSGTHAVHEDRELAYAFRAVGQALPGPVAGGVAAGERRERDASDAAREEEVESVHGGLQIGRASCREIV